jgi:hypothetical protein
VNPHDAYGEGYAVGVVHERNGIITPERGYSDDPLYLRGLERGRADYRAAMDSLLTPSHDAVSFPRLVDG